MGEVSEERFGERFDAIDARTEAQQVWVIEDAAQQRIIASATLLIELKFIHNISRVTAQPTSAAAPLLRCFHRATAASLRSC